MPKQVLTYTIDDAKSVDENLAEFASKLTELDQSMASVLSPVLQSMSYGDPVDIERLRTELLNAVTSKPEAGLDTGGGDA